MSPSADLTSNNIFDLRLRGATGRICTYEACA